MSSKKTKATAEVSTAPLKSVLTNIYKTTYNYWRHWVKEILITGKVKKYRFVKDDGTYNGSIAVDKTEVDAAKKVLAEYKKKNPDIKDMWWD
jgi:3-phosphoglycerate kinase